jgi:hypothetical protein
MVYYDSMNKNIFIGSIFIFASVLMISTINNNDYSSAYAQGNTEFTATLSGKDVVPSVKTSATGVTSFDATQNSLNYQINVLNAGTITKVQIHSGAIGENGDVLVTLFESKGNNANLLGKFPNLPSISPKVSDISTNTQRSSSFSASGNVQASDLTGQLSGKTINDLVSTMQTGNTYVNVHTEEHPEGELRGQITAVNES